MTPTALIAEDEPLLAQALQAELLRQWPELQVLAVVGDGESAVHEALAQRPQVLFLDIRMPGMDGLEAAAELADAWPDGQPFPALVFVTAYDQYAVQAFEAQALDYLLKPVMPERLAQTVGRLRERLKTTTQPTPLDHTLEQLRALLASAPAPTEQEPLTTLPVAQGDTVRLVPVDAVLALQAADKYVRVVTADGEHWIRTPLKELLPRLSGQQFWQVHRGTVVRASAVDVVHRDEAGRLTLTLKGLPERWAVSRLHAHRFKPL